LVESLDQRYERESDRQLLAVDSPAIRVVAPDLAS